MSMTPELIAERNRWVSIIDYRSIDRLLTNSEVSIVERMPRVVHVPAGRYVGTFGSHSGDMAGVELIEVCPEVFRRSQEEDVRIDVYEGIDGCEEALKSI